MMSGICFQSPHKTSKAIWWHWNGCYIKVIGRQDSFYFSSYVCLKFCKIKKKETRKNSVEYGERRHCVAEWVFLCRHCHLPQNTSYMLIMITENDIMCSNKLEKHYVKKKKKDRKPSASLLCEDTRRIS